MFLVDNKQEGTYSLPVKDLEISKVGVLGSELAGKILHVLGKGASYPKKIAKELKQNEQKIYYHIRNLEKAGVIRLLRKEEVHGATANYYELVQPGFVVRFSELKLSKKIGGTKEDAGDFLSPFIKDGELNALIIVGSPDPHGPDKARSRDGYYGMDLALFLGTYLNYVPEFRVKLDTEVRSEDLRNNLIVIGGPIVNKVTGDLNKFLPVFFDKDDGWNIKSSVTGNAYPQDECGLVVKVKNPYDKEKAILVLAGKRHFGTRAAIISFLKHFDEIVIGNKKNNKVDAKVIEGVDLDSDGIIDDVEVRE